MSVVLAIVLGLIAYSALNIGMILEKKGASMLPNIEENSIIENLKNFLGCKIWVLGTLIAFSEVVLLLIALTFASLSLISPLFGFGLVVLTIFSRSYLREEIYKVEYVGIVIIITGIALLGLFFNPILRIYTVNEIASRYFSPFSIIFFISFTSVAIIACIYSVLNKYKSAAIIFGFACGLAGAFGDIFMKGMSSGFNQFSLEGTFLNINWILMLIFAFAGSGLSMILLQIGFQKGRAVIVAPLYSVISVLFPSISGIIILNEWAGQANLNMMNQIIGIILIIIGIIILSFYNELKKAETG